MILFKICLAQMWIRVKCLYLFKKNEERKLFSWWLNGHVCFCVCRWFICLSIPLICYIIVLYRNLFTSFYWFHFCKKNCTHSCRNCIRQPWWNGLLKLVSEKNQPPLKNCFKTNFSVSYSLPNLIAFFRFQYPNDTYKRNKIL